MSIKGIAMRIDTRPVKVPASWQARKTCACGQTLVAQYTDTLPADHQISMYGGELRSGWRWPQNAFCMCGRRHPLATFIPDNNPKCPSRKER